MREEIPRRFYNGFSINSGDVQAKIFKNNQGEIGVKSWAGLVQVISFLTSQNQPYYWRGQANSKWDIDSTAKRQGFSDDQLSQQLDIFKKAARPYIEKDKGDEEVLVIGRHYGLATPLIDFSETAYKALFFACEEEFTIKDNSEHHRVLWVFDRLNFEGRDRDSEHVKDVYTHSHINNRLIAQDGLIIRLAADKHLVEIMDLLSSGDEEPLLFKITFADSLREEILINLMHMGITHKTIYPDIDGAAMFSNMTLKIRGYQLRGVSLPSK